MKTELKAKFLQHLNQKRQDKGFTLIELLVVIIIIGILSAIALPSFLSQANKAKQSEAKQYLASINKGQQAYYAENSVFSATLTDLGLGIKDKTNNYTYTIGATSGQGVTAGADPASGLKSYGSVVGLVGSVGAATTQSVLCEGASGAAAPAQSAPATGATQVDCAASTTQVTK